MRPKITLLFIIVTLVISSCNSNKNMPDTSSNPSIQLHDIWALKAINGKEINSEDFNERKKLPVLEIFVSEKRIGGNDGCNALFGSIETLDNAAISFGKMGGTKMMCADMELPNSYMKALGAVASYKLENFLLYLYNAEGDEVLRYLKVD